MASGWFFCNDKYQPAHLAFLKVHLIRKYPPAFIENQIRKCRALDRNQITSTSSPSPRWVPFFVHWRKDGRDVRWVGFRVVPAIADEMGAAYPGRR